MPETSLRILMVEDSDTDAQLILRELHQADLHSNIVRVDNEADYLAHLNLSPHLILCDFNLPQFDAMRALELLQERDLDIPFLIVSGSIGEETATKAMKQGATDYLLKDRLARLGPAIRQALAQQKLRDAEREIELRIARDALLLASVHDSVIVTDLEGIVTYWNEGATRLFGWTAEEMLGRPYIDRFPQPYRTTIAGLIQERVDGTDWNGEFEDYRKDGSRVWIQARVNAIRDSDGNPEGILGLAYDITDRKRVEEDLHHILLSGLCLFWSAVATDQEGPLLKWHHVRCDEANAQRFLPLDIPPGSHYMKAIYESLHPEDRVRTGRYEVQQIRAGQSYSQDYRCKGKDGTWHWHHEDVHVETIGPGRWRIVAVTTDITERMEAEEEFRHIMRSARCLFWGAIVIDEGEEFLHWQFKHFDEESAQRFLPLDLAPGEHYLRKAYASRHPDDKARIDKWGTENVRTGQSYSQEYRCQGKDGQWYWHYDDVEVETIAPGRWHVVVVTTDITERKREEEARRELEKRFVVMANSAPVLIWMSGVDGKCDWFNKARLDFTGRALEEELGDGWIQNLHPDDREKCIDTYHSAFGGQESFRLEYRMRRFDGVYRWFLDVGSPRFAGETDSENDTPGDFLGYIGCCVDVTEKYEAEQERITSTRQQQVFLRDVLFSVTEGHLYLCGDETELPISFSPPPGEAEVNPIPLTTATLSEVRQQVKSLAAEASFPEDRAMSMMSAASECAMNAVTHGGERAEASVLLSEDGATLQVWVRDYGSGIDVSELPKATLMKGYSGQGTIGGFGHGFFLILQYVDRIYLLTGPQGTTVVIEQGRTPPSNEFDF